MEQTPSDSGPKTSEGDLGCFLQVAAAVCTFIILLFVPATRHSLNLSLSTKVIITVVQVAALIVMLSSYPRKSRGCWEASALAILSGFVLFMALGNLGMTWLHH